MAEKKESFFWTSYSDLMTSLFFIMLTLFILVIVLLHKRMEVTEAQLDKIRQVEESTKDLESEYFKYDEQYEKFVLNIQCWFPVNKYEIDLLDSKTRAQLIEAGQQIVSFLNKHSGTQYLVIIEGQASKDSSSMMWYNYELSFHRAMSLRCFWESDKTISFPGNCEIQIAGSGDGTLNVATMREKAEEMNQRFLIYVIPKNIMKDDKQ